MAGLNISVAASAGVNTSPGMTVTSFPMSSVYVNVPSVAPSGTLLTVTDCAPAPMSSLASGSSATGVSSRVVKVSSTASGVGVTVMSIKAPSTWPSSSVITYPIEGTMPAKSITGVKTSVAASAGESTSPGITVIVAPVNSSTYVSEPSVAASGTFWISNETIPTPESSLANGFKAIGVSSLVT